MNLPEQRVCSKCGNVRDAGVERCPQCGTRRSRMLRHKLVSFWALPLADRRRLAAAMYSAITKVLNAAEAAQLMFIEQKLPHFKEFARLYRMFRWSWIVDGEQRIDQNWYRRRPNKRVNPFTGLLWPPRG